MQYEISGTVKEVLDQVTFDSGFTKREFVVTTDEKFPQDILLECIKDKTVLLDDVKVGENLTVDFDMRGNNKNKLNRYFGSNVAWRIKKLDSNSGSNPAKESDDLDELPW